AEGTAPGAGGNLQFVINRTGDLSAAVTIGYSVGPGATNGATAADIGGSFPSGSVNLPANVAQGFLAFAASPDALDEPDETITLTLTSTSVGTIGTQSSATITILDDDLPPPVFTVAPLNANVAEGTAPGAGGNLQFVINRTGDLSAAVTIGYSVGPGATNGATAEDLGGSFPSGSVNLPANVAQGFLAFAASPDALDEPDETITLALTSTSIGTIGTQSSATITILDDDDAPASQVPTDIALSHTTLGPNPGPGTLVGLVSGTDPDPDDTLSFSFAPGGDAGGRFAILGDRLETALPLGPGNWTVTLRASDIAGGSIDESFTIAVGRNRTGTDATERLPGTAGDDSLAGLGGDDRLLGRAGDDRIAGGEGNDTMLGEQGDDTLHGDAGRDRLVGGDGDDSLAGGTSTDTLFGGAGADVIRGGANDGMAVLAMVGIRLRALLTDPEVINLRLPGTLQPDGAADVLLYTAGLDGVDLVLGFETGRDVLQLDMAGDTAVVQSVQGGTWIGFAGNPGGILLQGVTGLTVGTDLVFA
uniref:calcium-binding protein n=1 Tax=Falsiroseomonas oryzae TaxID=2766473 RepID=UPI0022EA9B98